MELRISVAFFIVLLGAGLLVLWAAQRRLIYFPSADLPSPSEAGVPRAEQVLVRTDDRLMLGGWFVPATGEVAHATAIVFNGNAGNRALRGPLAAALAARGISTLLFDYRGYGGNTGSPSEAGLALDARAARRYVASRADVDPQRIVYFGESLGAAVAVGLAIEQPPSALVLRSPFTSLAEMGRAVYPFLPVSFLLRDRFPSLDRIAQIKSPLLVIAAGHDTIVPTAQSKRLYAAAASPKRLMVVEEADHNDYELLAGRRVVETIAEFISSVAATART